MCGNKAHDQEHLGIGGRRVQVSRGTRPRGFDGLGGPGTRGERGGTTGARDPLRPVNDKTPGEEQGL